jgi:hypothetical protein
LQYRLGLAASVLVPWPETNQRHNVEIEVMTDDGGSLAKLEGQVEVGRPAGHPPGQEQRAQIAGNMTLELKEPGTYAIVGRVGGQEARRIHFNVVEGPMVAFRRAPGQSPAA